MMTLGIDVGKFKHNATLLDDQGRKVFHNMSFENNVDGVEKLIGRIKEANLALSGITVGMEATGHYWMNLFAELETRKFADVHLVNPIIIHARRNETIRGAKTDRLDAYRIAKYLREADCRVCAMPDDDVSELRKLTRLRYDLSHDATSEKLRIVSLLDRVFPEYQQQFRDIFSVSSLKVLEDFPSAESIARVDLRRLTGVLRKASRGRYGRGKAQKLKDAAKNSFARRNSSEALQIAIQFSIQQLSLMLDQIDRLEKMIKMLMKKEQEILKSIPGVGDVWAPTILAEILPVFHPDHKDGGRKLVAHAGLDAIPKLTGKDNSRQDVRFRMSKRGSKYLRSAVMQASCIAALSRNDPMFSEIYERQRAKGKTHIVALSHVAHKMLHVIFALLRDNKMYAPVLGK